MPAFELYAKDGRQMVRLTAIEAHDVEEAIGLAFIRLERRHVELRLLGIPVARISEDGCVTRLGLGGKGEAVHIRLADEASIEDERTAKVLIASNVRHSAKRPMVGPDVRKRDWR